MFGTYRRTGVAVVGLLLTVSASVACAIRATESADPDDGSGSGPFSAFSKQELSSLWEGSSQFPLLVPETLPPGSSDREPVGFELENVIVDPDDPPEARVWLAFYNAEILDPSNSQIRVFQRRNKVSPDEKACGAAELPYLERRVGESWLTICGAALANEEVQDYWQKVDFTENYAKVSWLR